jgi:Tryptophan halogenase
MLNSYMKKIAIIGRGTAGCMAVTHFLKHTDWDIDWYFDPNTPPQAVGEGSGVDFPQRLYDNIQFNFNDLLSIDGSVKLGIKKDGWGEGNDFIHVFNSGVVGFHFNAVRLQDWVINRVDQEPRVKKINSRVNSYTDIDSDYIMDCSGRPSESELNQFHLATDMAVNSVHVTQCYWDGARFPYTLTVARPYGWVFGIPLRNRCSIGYMYHNDCCSLDDVKEDVKQVFSDYNLTPSEDTNTFNFKNYYRKQNFYGRVAYNGNASFFLEPLEATSISCMFVLCEIAIAQWTGKNTLTVANNAYDFYLNSIQDMLCLHYLKNNKYNTAFWNRASEKSTSRLEKNINNHHFKTIINKALTIPNDFNVTWAEYHANGYGTWGLPSYVQNIKGLGIIDDLKRIIK